MVVIILALNFGSQSVLWVKSGQLSLIKPKIRAKLTVESKKNEFELWGEKQWMIQWIKVLVAKAYHMSSTLRLHMIEENQSIPASYLQNTHIQKHTHKHK